MNAGLSASMVTNAFRREAGLSLVGHDLQPLPLVCVTNAFRREAGLSRGHALCRALPVLLLVTNAFRREAGLSLVFDLIQYYLPVHVTNAFRREAGLSPRVSLTRVGRAYKGPKGREWPLRAFGRGHGY